MTTAMNRDDLVKISIMNKSYFVPGEATIMQAMEFSGYQFVRGCGCRGGVCGACSVVYRMPGRSELMTGLACQSRVLENMQLLQIPFFPVNKAQYRLDLLEASVEQVRALYPDITRCMGCNACTETCPMEIDVMNGISEILKSDIEAVSIRSTGCTMCGLCAARCPAGLAPYLYFLLCRRLDGRHIKKPFVDVLPRIEEIESGTYEEELSRLVAMNPDELKQLYQEAQKDKRII
jgi:ferredoxin